MERDEWVWMPHAGHLIVGNDCRFHLNTYVGGYIVSTVGEYLPDAPVREIIANSRGVALKGRGDERLHDYMEKVGFEEVGCGRKYETYVFRASTKSEGGCCPWRPSDWSEIEGIGSNDPDEATRNHYAMCEKWSEVQP